MHGLVVHGCASDRIVCSSSLVGNRQSHSPAKQPPLFNEGRKPVKTLPSPGAPVLLHVYRLSASCGSARFPVPSGLSFFSHVRPVRLSVTVSPLSTNLAPSHGVA